MAINGATKKLLKSFEQKADDVYGFTSLCSTPPENYYKSETIAFDSFYEDINIAPAVKSISETGERIAIDSFKNSEFTPPILKQSFFIPAECSDHRQIGDSPFKSPEYMANIMRKFERHAVSAMNSQRRSIEYMIAQMLQTGKIVMPDPSGADSFDIDFKQKDTHLGSFSTAWTDSENATPFEDLEDLADVLVKDGYRYPEMVVMSKEAYSAFVNTKQYLEMADNRRANIVSAGSSGYRKINGMIFKDRLNLTSVTLDIFVYSGYFKDIDGVTKNYMKSGSVIMMPYDVRIDLTFGAIPLLDEPKTSELGWMSFRTKVVKQADFTTNIYRLQDGSGLEGFIGCRPLPILTAKNQIACGNCGA